MGTLDGPTAVNRSQNMSAPISKKRKFVADGVFYAELNEMLARELSEQNYAGVEVRVTPNRFGFKDGAVELYAQKVVNRGLCAVAQAESLRFKLALGLPVRRACYGIVRYIMESEAKGCEVVVTGKLRAARAKVMKFVDGYMIKTGEPSK